MVEAILSALASMQSSTIADFFLFLIAAAFIAAIIPIFKGKPAPHSLAAPGLLTSIGILGTFFGISIGLASFDFSSQTNIDQSIPALLGGMKLAFVTSVAGLIAALIVRISLIIAVARQPEEHAEVGAPEILAAIKGQTKATLMVRNAVAGDEDQSLITQLQKLRTDVADGAKDVKAEVRASTTAMKEVKISSATGLEKIASRIGESGDHTLMSLAQFQSQHLREGLEGVRASLNEFGEKITEMSSKHLIEALSEIIKDFNANLTEQFGENFKRLDDSVQKLVVWQDQYKGQMELLKSDLDRAAESVEHSDASLGRIRENSEAIPNLMSSLGTVILGASSQVDDLEQRLAVFAEMGDKASDALPKINENLDLIGSKLTETTSKTAEQLDKCASDLGTAGTKATESMKATGALLLSTITEFDRLAEENMKAARETILETSETMRQEAQAGGRQREKILSEEMDTMDKAIRQELNRQMEEMGNALLQIVNRFVDDYSDLTKAMEQVVRRADENLREAA